MGKYSTITSSGGISDVVLSSSESVLEYNWVITENDMASNSEDKLPNQRSVKTFVDEKHIDGGVF